MALSRIDTTNMIEDVPQSKIDNNINFRNIIINGDMSIAQRSTSETNVSTGYKTCDRWRISRGAGQITMSQATDAPTGSGFVKSLKFLEASSGANPGANDFNLITQRIEGQNLQYLLKGTSSAKSLTLSFWIKASVTGTYIAHLTDDDNSRFISKAYTVSSANTWEYKTVTFPADTTGAFANDNGRSLDVELYFGAGSNFTSGTLNTTWNSYTAANQAVGQVNALASANDYVQFTGVQLEAGTTASDFEFLPYDVNLQRCQRYYYKRLSENAYGPGSQGMQIGSSNVMIQGYHPVVMRSAPSMSGSNWSIEYSGSSAAWSMGSTRTSTTAWSSENSLSGTDGNAAILYANNNTAADITGDSEL